MEYLYTEDYESIAFFLGVILSLSIRIHSYNL